MARKRDMKKALEAARLVASGEYTNKQVAEMVGCCEATVSAWLKDPAVLDEYRKTIQASIVPAFAKAIRLYVRQMENQKMPWLAQNAAREITNRFGAGILGSEEKDVVIRFEEGQSIPVIGVPAAPSDE